MSKVDKILSNYLKESGLMLEQDPMAPPPMDPMAAPPAAAVPPPGGEPAPEGGGETETKTLTDQGYVEAVRDMLELLSINPDDIEESDLDIFNHKINPKNAFDKHEDLKDLITRYGSPTVD
jgi:hypothetical protein|tara:strand:- start:272 stop:634 length:363 start_codon:yes stop_codon:yes gene_type:complete